MSFPPPWFVIPVLCVTNIPLRRQTRPTPPFLSTGAGAAPAAFSRKKLVPSVVINEQPSEMLCCRFSPDATLVAAGCADGTSAPRHMIVLVVGGGYWNAGVVFKLHAIGWNRWGAGKIRVYKTETGRLLYTLNHDNRYGELPVTSLRFRPEVRGGVCALCLVSFSVYHTFHARPVVVSALTRPSFFYSRDSGCRGSGWRVRWQR